MPGDGNCPDTLRFAGVQRRHVEQNFTAHTFGGFGKRGVETFDQDVDGPKRELQFDGFKRHHIVWGCPVR